MTISVSISNSITYNNKKFFLHKCNNIDLSLHNSIGISINLMVIITSFFSPAMVELMIKGTQPLSPSAFDVIEHCLEGGHCLMVSYPNWTADTLIRAAIGSAQEKRICY